MKKKGKCPSLITGNHGKPNFEIAGRERTCKRCGGKIPRDTRCVSIPVPGTMGSKTYCVQCLSDIITQSRKDLDKIEGEVKNG